MVATVGNWISQNCTTVGATKLILSTAKDSTLLRFQDVLPAGQVYYSA